MPKVKLQSNDGVVIEADSELLKCSSLLTSMLEYCDDDENDVVPLLRVNKYILRKVLLWAEYHQHDPPQLANNRANNSEDIGPWDTQFIKMNPTPLIHLMMAANYLGIEALEELTCKALANLFIGKTPEQIRRTFNIVNDFTSEEERQIRRENAW